MPCPAEASKTASQPSGLEGLGPVWEAHPKSKNLGIIQFACEMAWPDWSFVPFVCTELGLWTHIEQECIHTKSKA